MGGSTRELMFAAADRLCKWRTVYAGWRLGTRSKEDGQSQYTRDLHEMLLLLRAEVSALTFAVRELALPEERLFELFLQEYTELDRLQSEKFPGFKSHQYGIDIDVAVARETMSRKGFPL